MALPPFFFTHGHTSRLQKSVVTPLLILAAIVWAGSIYALPGADPDLRMFLMAAMGVTLVATLIAFAYFAKSDPDRLHTEEHRKDMQVLKLIGDDRTSAPTLIKVLIQDTPTTNPHLLKGPGND